MAPKKHISTSPVTKNRLRTCPVPKATSSMKTSNSPLHKDTATSYWSCQFPVSLTHTRHRVECGGYNCQLWRELTRLQCQICCLVAEGPWASLLTSLYLGASSICNKEKNANTYFLRKQDEE
ncbi:hypothetical protein mRhiFer1_009304 [Rhinolophus ferrumequinum]|uniref:Uncharacterized protein n=1 Tax=Rhinolophus ferrumequinum TaxID=59479 RepID=A0A7J7RYD8_RHIFE|nr:hypothetical protein mRhiFer1_009304 [Rhinolophus ferrumequinum]